MYVCVRITFEFKKLRDRESEQLPISIRLALSGLFMGRKVPVFDLGIRERMACVVRS